MGGQPIFRCGVFKPKAGGWEQPISNLTFALAQRPQETPRCSQISEVPLVEQVYAVLSSDQLENDCNTVIKKEITESSGAAESLSSKSNINLSRVSITLRV